MPDALVARMRMQQQGDKGKERRWGHRASCKRWGFVGGKDDDGPGVSISGQERT